MNWETASNFAQTLALLAALSYFIYRAVAGWYNIAASISVDTVRARSEVKGKDALLITLHIEQGEYGALFLLDAEARISIFNHVSGKRTSLQSLKFEDIRRVGTLTEKKHFLHFINEDFINWEKSLSRPYRLSPKERTHFSCLAYVDNNLICHVEVAILGRKPLSTAIAQWRASTISFPLKNNH